MSGQQWESEPVGAQVDERAAEPAAPGADPAAALAERYRAVLGPKNQDYYLAQFARLDRAGKALSSWHWPAFFTTLFWLVYRRMWLAALGYFILPGIVMLPVRLIFGSDSLGTEFLKFVYWIAVYVVPAMYANAFYHWHCKRKIARAAAEQTGQAAIVARLQASGGTSRTALLATVTLVMLVSTAVAVQTYQTLKLSAQPGDATLVGKRASDAVANYYEQYHAVPSSLEQAGVSGPLPPSVATLTLAPDGTVTVTLKNGAKGPATLRFAPAFGAPPNTAK